MKHLTRILLVLVALALVVSPVLGAADVIKIGTVQPMTGDVATYGLASLEGFELAVDEINAAGGVLGKKIVLVKEDTKGDATETRNVVEKLISRDKVVALYGEAISANTIAGGTVAQQLGVPMISSASTAVKVTQVGDYIFRVCYIDPVQANFMAKFAAQNLKIKKVAILQAITDDYSMGLAKDFKAAFQKLGGTIVAEQSYSKGDSDYTAQLTRIKAANPEAIYLPGYYTDVATIARQARQLGIKVPFMGADGYDSPKLYELGGEAVVGSYFVNPYSKDNPSPKAKAFLKAFRAKYGKDPDGFAAQGYDAALVLADAIKRAGKADPKAIKNALAKTKGVQGVTGSITLDANRNPLKGACILKVNADGTYGLAATINL